MSDPPIRQNIHESSYSFDWGEGGGERGNVSFFDQPSCIHRVCLAWNDRDRKRNFCKSNASVQEKNGVDSVSVFSSLDNSINCASHSGSKVLVMSK